MSDHVRMHTCPRLLQFTDNAIRVNEHCPEVNETVGDGTFAAPDATGEPDDYHLGPYASSVEAAGSSSEVSSAACPSCSASS